MIKRFLENRFNAYMDKKFSIYFGEWYDTHDTMDTKRSDKLGEHFSKKVQAHINSKIKSIGEEYITEKLMFSYNEETEKHIKKYSDKLTESLLQAKFNEYVDTAIENKFAVNEFKDDITKILAENTENHLARNLNFLNRIVEELRRMQLRQ